MGAEVADRRRARDRPPRALSWNELASPDIDASAAFYTELFDWSVEPMEGMEMPYMVIKNKDGASNGGIRPTMDEEPTYWLVYFGYEDVGAGLEKVDALGGGQVAGPIDIAVGPLGIARDPQGAVFAFYSGRFDP